MSPHILGITEFWLCSIFFIIFNSPFCNFSLFCNLIFKILRGLLWVGYSMYSFYFKDFEYYLQTITNIYILEILKSYIFLCSYIIKRWFSTYIPWVRLSLSSSHCVLAFTEIQLTNIVLLDKKALFWIPYILFLII